MAAIKGTLFDDVLIDVAGVDTISGLAGNDVILLAAAADYPPGEKIDGSTGFDRLWFTSAVPETLTLLAASVTGIEVVEMVDAVGNVSSAALNVNAAAMTAIATGFTLTGNNGANQLIGTAGIDLITGGAGADTITGGLGNDRIVMSVVLADIDQIDAGVLATESNTLALVGGAGGIAIIDLSVAANTDQLTFFDLTAEPIVQSDFSNVDASGMSGFGVQVTASLAKNTLVGGAQADVFLYLLPTHMGTDVVSGGAGTDSIRFISTTAGQTLLLSAGVNVDIAQISDAAGVTTGVTALNLSAASVKQKIALGGNDGNNTITGSAFDDTLNGNGGADNLVGGAGNDVYAVDSAVDWVDGPLLLDDKISDSAGTNDRIAFIATVASTLVLTPGITGIESVWTTELDFDITDAFALNVNGAAVGKMAYVGNAGPNQFIGGIGNDTFTGNAGTDDIIGGAGSDLVIMDVASPDQADGGNASATEGNTLKLVGDAVAPVEVDLSLVGDLDQGVTLLQTQADFRHVDASELEGDGVIVTGSALANILKGSAQSDFFVVLSSTHVATDTIEGGGGTDTLRFASTIALQTLALSASVKSVEVFEIADATGLTTGITALNMSAAALTNPVTLRGNDGANLLTGTKFGDTIDGNLGADTLQGALGNDTYLYTAAAAFTALERIIDSGGTADIVKFDAAGGTLVVAGATGIESYVLDNLANNLAPTGFDLSAVLATLPGANVQGNDGDNVLIGTKGKDTIHGFLGADSIHGGSNISATDNDVLDGDEGVDTIVGGTGHDTITTVAEELDEIHGGLLASENNLLRLTGDAVTPVIMNLNLADQILSGAGVQDGITYVDASGMAADVDPLIFTTPGLTITGRTTTRGDNIIGSPRNDDFTPGLGADTIEGGGGSDDWFVTSNADMTGDVYTDSGGTLDDFIIFVNATNNATLTLTAATVGSGIDTAVANFGIVNLNINASGLAFGMSMQGNDGNNILTGTPFGDTFFDFGGVDTLIGGLGPDEYVVDGNWVVGALGDTITEAAGQPGDHFYYGAAAGVLVALPAKLANIELFAVSGSNVNFENISFGGTTYRRDVTAVLDGGIDATAITTAIHLAGSYGANVLTGTNNALGDTIIGWKGQDTISGKSGNDHIVMSVAALDIDEVNAGENSGDADRLLLHGAPGDANGGVVEVDLVGVDVDPGAGIILDQVVSINGVAETLLQQGFDNFVDASQIERFDGALDDANFGVILKGTALGDTFIGSDGDDIFIGRAGVDSISGGGGDDAFAFTLLTELTTSDTLNGGGGDDAIWFTSITAGQTLTLNPNGATGQVLLNIEEAWVADTTGLTTGTTALNINAVLMTSGMKLVGNDGVNTLTGGTGADTLIGNGDADNLVGGAGNDLYLIQLAGEVVNGGTALTSDRITDSSGTDTLRFVSEVASGVVLTPYMANLEAVEIWDGPDTLVGALLLDLDASLLPDAVKLTGSKFDNQITGTAFADSIDGGEGNDTLFGGTGSDTLKGGDGNDSLVGGGGGDSIATSLDDLTADDFDAGLTAEGNFVLLTGELLLAMEWDLTDLTDQLFSMHGAVDRVFLGVTHLDLSALTGDFGITITGTAEANTLITGKNDDVFITATPFAPGETITAGLGNDTLRFTSVSVIPETLQLTALITGIESVEISDAAGDNTGTFDLNINAALVVNALSITGNDGDNILTGTAKADTIIGGLGADTINAGTGADEIYDDAAAGVLGRIIAGAVTEGNKLTLSGTLAADLTVNLSLATGDQISGGVDADTQSGFMHVDGSSLTGGALIVTGSTAANRIIGTAGDDTLVGGLGADTLGVDASGGDVADAGAISQGNLLLLSGAGAGTVTVDLNLTDGNDTLPPTAGDDQVDILGIQSGFLHADASGMTTSVTLVGSAAANRLTGSQAADSISGGAGNDSIDGGLGADTLNGGLGADVFTWDAATAGDDIDAGDPGDGDTFVAIGIATGNLTVNLMVAPGTDQFTSVAGDQHDFQHVDASKLEAGALNARGNALNNNLAGTALADTLYGGAGSDTLSLGLLDEMQDFVIFETRADGVNSIAAVSSFDRIKEFEAGRDELSFRVEFNSGTGRFNLDDINDNNAFAWVTDAKANFSATHEAMLISSTKSGILTEPGLASFTTIIGAINKFGVIAAGGDDGLIVVQSATSAGVYYYQESDGLANAVTAGELTLLGIVAAKAGTDDFSFG